MGFTERHQLYTDDQLTASKEALALCEREHLRLIRVVFADQHGLLRGKTVTAGELRSILRDGLPVVSTLLSKDASGTTVYRAFAPDGGVGMAEMAGAGDMIMVPDPSTFRVLDWVDDTGWLLCDLYFANGEPVPFCGRGLMRRAVAWAAELGYSVKSGAELEFHLFAAPGPAPGGSGAPGSAGPLGVAGVAGVEARVSPLNAGYQLLCEDRADALEPMVSIFARHLQRLGLPLRSIEVEFGPSQLEVTLAPQLGVEAADSVILLRNALKQVARRHGYHVTFMCRPNIPRVFSSGWHLHQSLLRGEDNAFVPDDPAEHLSAAGRNFLAGQLRHARAASVFAVPTINGYKRFRAYSMAPDRVTWARDNRGAMLRVTGSAADGSTHVENRVGEPAANPYLYLASQLMAGLNGVAGGWEPGPAVVEPYETDAPQLPTTLAEALDALEADREFACLLGEAFTGYYLGIKRHEVARFNAAVTDWEQHEYFELF